MKDLEALRYALDSGADVNEKHDGLSLFHHAVDIEVDGHVQSGEPLHVDTTGYLLARGADPTLPANAGQSPSAEQVPLCRGIGW